MTAPLVVRPKRLTRTAWAVAVMLLVAFAGIGALLRSAPPGEMQFQLGDQLAITALGLAGAGAVLWFTRFRVVADAHGVRVRNAVGEKHLPWGVVVGVRFVPGDSWAHLLLHDDELLPLLAVQANDGRLADEAVEHLRRLMAESRA